MPDLAIRNSGNKHEHEHEHEHEHTRPSKYNHLLMTWGCAPTRRNAHDLLSSLTLYLR